MPMPSVGRPSACPLRVQHVQPLRHRERRLHRVIRVRLVVQRRAEQRHHHVADELVERAAVLEHDLDHPREVLVQLRDERFRLAALGDRREAAHVREQHAHRPPRCRPARRAPGSSAPLRRRPSRRSARTAASPGASRALPRSTATPARRRRQRRDARAARPATASIRARTARAPAPATAAADSRRARRAIPHRQRDGQHARSERHAERHERPARQRGTVSIGRAGHQLIDHRRVNLRARECLPVFPSGVMKDVVPPAAVTPTKTIASLNTAGSTRGFSPFSSRFSEARIALAP